MVYKLFYIIYNAYYKHGEYKNDIPPLTVGGIFLGCFFSLGLLSYVILGWGNPIYYKVPKINKPTMLIFTMVGLLIYFLLQ